MGIDIINLPGAIIQELFKKRVRENPKSIVFPEGEDIRVMKAVSMLRKDGLIKNAVLIGNPDIIIKNAESLSLNEDYYTQIDIRTISRDEKYREEYRKARNLSILENEMLEEDIQDPIVAGALLLRLGEVDGYIAGLQTSTAKILSTGINVIKANKRIGVVTAFSLVYTDTRERRFKSVIGEESVILIADPVVNPDPSVGVLCKIAEASAAFTRNFLKIKPSIAFLSYSTKGSGQGKSVDKMRIAAERSIERMPEYKIDGELQLDAAIMPEISGIKSPDSPLKGVSNILIFPNLDAANISSKVIKFFGNAKIIGPIIYGLNKPFNDVSRGSNEYDVYDLAIITQLQT